MVGQIVLLIVLAAMPTALAHQGGHDPSCDYVSIKVSSCASIVGGSVAIGAGRSSRRGGSRPGAGADPTNPPTPPICEDGAVATDCLLPSPVEITPSKGAVSIHDLRAFRPRASVAHMEPNGWAVIGLDTDFWATTPNESESGPLLGKRADVRFEPVAYTWDYGDGTTRTAASAGGSWAALGLAEFAPTPSSHVYAHAGSYSVRLSVTFAAEYRYGGGAWQTVAGTIAVASAPIAVRAGSADTVLVGGDCTRQPTAPGC